MLRSSIVCAVCMAAIASQVLSAMCRRVISVEPNAEGGFLLVDGSGSVYANVDDYPPGYVDFDGAEVSSVLYTYEHLTFQGGPRPRFETDAFFKATLALLRKFRRHK